MQIPITLSRHTKANRGKLILFQYRLPFSAFQGHSWYSDKPNYIAENTFNLYTLCCFFEKHKAWLTPNPHLLPLICPGLMVWAPFPKVFISIYFISVLLKTDISIVTWIYWTLILESPLPALFTLHILQAVFWRLVSSLLQMCFIFPPPLAPGPEELQAPQAELDQLDCLGGVGWLLPSLSTLFLWGWHSEVDRNKKKDPTEATPVLFTFMASSSPFLIPCHMPFRTISFCKPFSLINFANQFASVKVTAWLECKEKTEQKYFLFLNLFLFFYAKEKLWWMWKRMEAEWLSEQLSVVNCFELLHKEFWLRWPL